MPEYINRPSYPNTPAVFGYTLDGNLLINRKYVNKNKWRIPVPSTSLGYGSPDPPDSPPAIMGFGLALGISFGS